MNTLNKTLKFMFFVVLGTGLNAPVLAEHNQNTNIKYRLHTDYKQEIEVYDYHSGTTYTTKVPNFVLTKTVEKSHEDPDNECIESTVN